MIQKKGTAHYAYGALASTAPLLEAGTSLYYDAASNLLTWQTGDPIGFGEASDIIGNFLPTPPGITATGSGAVIGYGLTKFCDSTNLVTTGSCH